MNLATELLYWDAKSPADTLDYLLDFNGASPGPWLATGDTITSATVTALPADLIVDSTTHTPTTVTVWLSGGTSGTEYTVSASVVTAQGRSAVRSAILYVQQR